MVSNRVVGLLTTAGLALSNSEARRLIMQGGVRLNNETVTSPNAELAIKDGTILQVGKRKIVKLKVAGR